MRTNATRSLRAVLLALAAISISQCGRGDDFVLGPTPPPGPVGGPTETASIYPFLIKEMVPEGSPQIPTMRYQQVYNASLFTNLNPTSIYVTTMKFWTADPVLSWTVPSVQINLSTTSNAVDGLSPVFSENVGADDTVVLGPRTNNFSGGNTNSPVLVLFDRPFRYNPALGNLLMDVRVFDGRGPRYPLYPPPGLLAYSSVTDEVSRVWATNVTAATADGVDSIGVKTVIQLSPVPSLTAEFFPLYAGALTNIIRIVWPSQPSVFVLQKTDRLGPNASWGPVTNQIEGVPSSGNRWIEFPQASAGSAAFYRLVWPGGYGSGEKTGDNQEPNQPP